METHKFASPVLSISRNFSSRSYDRLERPLPNRPYADDSHTDDMQRPSRRRCVMASVCCLLAVIATITLGTVLALRARSRYGSSSDSGNQQDSLSAGSEAIRAACNTTMFPDVCYDWLSADPSALKANPLRLAGIGVKVALDHVNNASALASKLHLTSSDVNLTKQAIEDCIELMSVSGDQLNDSIAELSSISLLSIKSSLSNVKVLLSGTMGFQLACTEGLELLVRNSSISSLMESQDSVGKAVSISLGLVDTLSNLGSDLTSWKDAVPKIHSRRRLLSALDEPEEVPENFSFTDEDGFPEWLSVGVRRLLQAAPPAAITSPQTSPPPVATSVPPAPVVAPALPPPAAPVVTAPSPPAAPVVTSPSQPVAPIVTSPPLPVAPVVTSPTPATPVIPPPAANPSPTVAPPVAPTTTPNASVPLTSPPAIPAAPSPPATAVVTPAPAAPSPPATAVGTPAPVAPSPPATSVVTPAPAAPSPPATAVVTPAPVAPSPPATAVATPTPAAISPPATPVVTPPPSPPLASTNTPTAVPPPTANLPAPSPSTSTTPSSPTTTPAITAASPSVTPGSYDVVVAQDGSGTYKTIKEALDNVPSKRSTRYTIYIKKGVYQEYLLIPKGMKLLTLVGDGMGQTIITGDKSNKKGITTYQTATVAVSGPNFIARRITFRNTAGAEGHQAVALRVNGDQAVLDSCGFEGYQDTLYALANRQFYTGCNIYGTVDFIFGNAIAVFQNCNLLGRLPMPKQYNTFTAQGRKLASDPSGYSFQKCTVDATPDLRSASYPVSNYFGRPWKAYSRTVFLQCNIGQLIDPAGWVAWDATNPFITTLYYGEYQNTGPGAGTAKRIAWKGVHPSMTTLEASSFTVDGFISGSSWLPSAKVAFQTSL